MSDILGTMIRLRVSTKGAKTIEHKAGIDNYLVSTPNAQLNEKARIWKRRIERRITANSL